MLHCEVLKKKKNVSLVMKQKNLKHDGRDANKSKAKFKQNTLDFLFCYEAKGK
jgi:hypothetical protein